jgi:16S rRNA (cytidine1402-2'-O)-methyltransferase
MVGCQIMQEPGLYVVATPIGNLEDLSPRAGQVLASVAAIAAEDTRHTRILLDRKGIHTPMLALHEHNEERVLPSLLERIRQGEAIALVSDAGTPLISDPGFRLVQAAAAAGLPVFAIPGPSALTAALSVAGLPSDRFVFEGFLPSRAGARRKRLAAFADEDRTMVFFEASHRIAACLEDLQTVFGADRAAVLCRELTKRFETVLRGSLQQLRERLDADANQVKGEFTLLVAGRRTTAFASRGEELARALLEYLPASQAARVAARITGDSRREIYAALGAREPG